MNIEEKEFLTICYEERIGEPAKEKLWKFIRTYHKEAIKEARIEENKLILKESFGSHHWIIKHLAELESK